MARLDAKPVAVCLVLGVSLMLTLGISTAHAGDGWPLRNGDFSRDHFIRQVTRPDWRQRFLPGTKVFREDRDPREPVIAGSDTWRPGVLNLQATNPDNPAAVFQEPWLLPGEYTFHLQARTEDGIDLLVSAGSGKTTYSGDGWADVAVNFSVPKAGTVTVGVGTEAAGNAKVRDARIDVRKVESASVPLVDGRTLGAIVLAGQPTEAEQYAAWELQKFIFKMTGKAPGVTGRDATAEGVRIYLGGAADDRARLRLDGLNEDGYVVDHRGDALFLTGTNDRGTLYAAYDFLKGQGCGWYWPGPSGEIVPERSALEMPSEVRVESPDWALRGRDKKRNSWSAQGHWMRLQLDDYIDWLVRNRQNALLASQSLTIDFGKWRGGSFNVRTNHSVMTFWWKEGEPIRMEWSPLVNGKREPKHLSGGHRNSPCTSNQDLRDHTVDVILRFFEQNPEYKVFGLNVDDNIQYYCECEPCRAQDPDEGKGEWKLLDWGRVPFPMTDRWMNYVNEVAERVGKVYPDKFIETYAYGIVRPEPKRERVAPNVMVRFIIGPGEAPYGTTMRVQEPVDLDRFVTGWKPAWLTGTEANRGFKRMLAGWRKAGAQDMCFHDLDNYFYPDTVHTWFYRMSNSMRVVHNDYGFKNYLSEQHALVTAASHMAYNLRARLLWDIDADYREVIRELCQKIYGPAGDTMYDYYCHMDQVIIDFWEEAGDTVKCSTRAQTALLEYTFDDMAVGKSLLDKAWAEVGDDAKLKDHVARVRFGHAMSTLIMAKTAGDKRKVEEVAPGHRKVTPETERQGREALQLARDLRSEYGFLGSSRLHTFLESD